MARYIVTGTSGTTVDGLRYQRGTVLNVKQSHPDVLGNTALSVIPRIRIADVGLNPPYTPLAAADQLGRRASTGALVVDKNVIAEPVLPTENSQYD